MKSAEDWFIKYEQIANEIRKAGLVGITNEKLHREGFNKFIAAIQSDAHKQGVIDGIKKAAEVARGKQILYTKEASVPCLVIHDALLTLATKIESGEVEV